MGILNRTKEASEQKERFFINLTGAVGGASAIISTGATFPAMIVPYPATVSGAQLAAVGISGSPQYTIAVNRFIAGTGFTTWVLATGASNIPAEFGTSGPGVFGTSAFGQSGMLLTNAHGSTLNILMANDLLTVTTGGTNAAARSVAMCVVLQPIQDVKVNFNLF